MLEDIIMIILRLKGLTTTGLSHLCAQNPPNPPYPSLAPILKLEGAPPPPPQNLPTGSRRA